MKEQWEEFTQKLKLSTYILQGKPVKQILNTSVQQEITAHSPPQ